MTQKRKIIFVVSALHGGGAERVVATLAGCFAGRGDDVTILMTAGTETEYRLHPEMSVVSVAGASGGSLVTRLKRIVRMRRFFKSNAEAVVVSFSTNTNMFVLMSMFGLGNRLILSERNDPRRCSYSRVRDFFYSLKGFYVFQTDEARECFRGRVHENSCVIPNPIRRELPEVYRGERRRVIAAAGRLSEQKNHRLLIRAFRIFSAVHPDYELHIFGRGELQPELETFARETVGEGVSFRGFSPDLLEEIKDCSMYVLSSDYEGISNSLMEAMALGLPCISTDCPIGGSRLLITPYDNGLLTPVGDENELAQAMISLASDRKLAERMGSSACRVREDYDEERIADRWREVCYGPLKR